jgi:hypothetical protein
MRNIVEPKHGKSTINEATGLADPGVGLATQMGRP